MLTWQPSSHLDDCERRPEMPNNFTTQELGTDNSDHAGAGGSRQDSPAEDVTALPSNPDGPPEANRHRLPDERAAVTHHFSIGGNEGYLTVGLYPNGQPGEVFIRMAKA